MPTDVESATFSLPDDSYLVALWTDGIASEYDPGIPVSIMLHGLTDHMVSGIDVLYNFEQPLIANEEG